MSQIAPDIPELSQVPQVVRGAVWTQATMRAISAPLTLVTAGIAAIVLGGLGVLLAGWFYLRVLVQWQARRLLPRVLREKNWGDGLDEVIRADERLKAIIASGRHRDSRS